ncbi:MAG: hypothetical protein ABIJ97_15580, partial [Bacteroidota bacterium]
MKLLTIANSLILSIVILLSAGFCQSAQKKESTEMPAGENKKTADSGEKSGNLANNSADTDKTASG